MVFFAYFNKVYISEITGLENAITKHTTMAIKL